MALRGESGWKATYKKQYGDRFLQLLPALRAKSNHVCVNPFEPLALEQASPLPIAYAYTAETGEENGYFLDAASVVAALALDCQPGQRVLDMCAAPGGKSLILAAQLFMDKPRDGTKLVCNEVSPQRAVRLKQTLTSYIPEDVRSSINVTHCDATATSTTMWSHGPYDRILLDAPCSSDRHLLQKGDLRSWSSATPKQCAERQVALLVNALQCLKPGGIVVYSTCALSTLENDGVIEKTRKKVAFESLTLEDALEGENTKWGTMFLPDKGKYGPLYVSRLRKT